MAAGVAALSPTRVLAGLNVAAWLLGAAIERLSGTDWVETAGARYSPAIWEGEVWRLLSAVFLHAGPLHLAFNTWALISVGPAVESVFGSGRMLVIYLLAGIAGNAASTLYGGEASVGASGAIFGLFGALVFFGVRHRERLSGRYWSALLPTVVVNLVYGFTQPRIDNWAHLGGLAGGFLGSLTVGLPPPPPAIPERGHDIPERDGTAGGPPAALTRLLAGLAIAAAVGWSLVPPTWFSLLQEGRRLARAERWTEAEAPLTGAVRRNPRSADAHYLLAIVYLNTRRRSEAIGELERVLQIYPGHPEVSRLLEQARRAR